MGWWSRRRQRPEAEESLERIESERREAERARAARVDPSTGSRLDEADRHMVGVMDRMGEMLVDVPAGEEGRFMVVVASVEDQPSGPVVTAEQWEGRITPGSVVAIMALPPGAADLPHEEALLGTRALAATVDSVDVVAGRLQLDGLAASDLTAGSMISR